jgi:23S rRNA (cytosine1962-C5)-methyltransferase
MQNYPRIHLKPGKEAAVKRFHPWLFSGAIHRAEGKVAEGSVVEIYSSTGEYLATGHYTDGSIAVKIFTFTQQEINSEFWFTKLETAFALRKKLDLVDNKLTNAYRLVFSEGDGLPGLFIDYYNGTAVIQTHTIGMHSIKSMLVEGLQKIYGKKLVAVYDKSEGEGGGDYLLGTSHQGTIKEIGHDFLVDWEKGQKTGFFLDQRNNRMFAQFYGKGKKVLNAFCYSGAFSVYALKGGATEVHSIDSSRQAIEWTEENVALNGIEEGRHKSFMAEAKKFLRESEEMYDMIILDPPAFAKHLHVSHNALQAYIHINTEAMKSLLPGGLLFTFSCSQPISREMFQGAIVAAGLQAGRKIQVLHHLSQGADHPVNLYHPEGAYLKGMILYVE